MNLLADIGYIVIGCGVLMAMIAFFTPFTRRSPSNLESKQETTQHPSEGEA